MSHRSIALIDVNNFLCQFRASIQSQTEVLGIFRLKKTAVTHNERAGHRLPPEDYAVKINYQEV